MPSSPIKSKTRILYLTTEVHPFLRISSTADWIKKLITDVDASGEYEVRVIMPKFGPINERKNSMHEVQRLSGINIRVKEEDISLVVKVGSMRPTRVQVYFLDNEYLFHRSGVFHDKNGCYYKDNADRIIFMNKSVLSVLSYLQWIPKIIHCVGWPWSFFPLYARKIYKKHAALTKVRYVYTHQEQYFDPTLGKDIFYKTAKEGENPSLSGIYDLNAPCFHYAARSFSEASFHNKEWMVGSAPPYIASEGDFSLDYLNVYRNFFKKKK